MRKAGEKLKQKIKPYAYFAAVFFALIMLFVIPVMNASASPPTIESIVNGVQQTHDSIITASGMLYVINDNSSATLSAAALISMYDENYSFTYEKPDKIELLNYKPVGYFHTTTTVKINYNSMQTVLKFGANEKQGTTDVPKWMANIINMKEMFADVLNYAVIVVETPYFNGFGEAIYPLKITPNGIPGGRRICTRVTYVDVNHARKRIERVRGFVQDSTADESEFIMTVDYETPGRQDRTDKGADKRFYGRSGQHRAGRIRAGAIKNTQK